MRPVRIFYYGLMPVWLLCGLYTGLTFFYTVLFMQLLLLVFVFFIDLWTIKTFRYSQKLDRSALIKGTDTKLRIRISNEKPIPMSLMEIVVDVVSMREDIKLVFSLAPFAERSFEIPITTPYRGCFDVGMTEMKITDIFGLMTLRFDMRKQPFYRMVPLLVYPKAEPLDRVAARMWDTKLFGASYLRQAENGDSISGMRSYRPGDPLRQVHWKNSIKHGDLFIKQYDTPLRERTLIFLDSCTRGLEGENAAYYADTMCQCAASVSLYSLKRGRNTRVAAVGNGGAIAECHSDYKFAPIHEWLAKLSYGTEDGLEHGLEMLTGRGSESSSLFVLTRRPSQQLITKLIELQGFVESVTLILVDDKKTLNESLHTLYVNTGDDVVLSLGNFT